MKFRFILANRVSEIRGLGSRAWPQEKSKRILFANSCSNISVFYIRLG